MPRRTLALLALILPLIGLSLAPLIVVNAAAYALLATSTVPETDDVKFPQVATFGSTVGVSANSNKRDAFLWEKADAAGSFGAATYLGAADGQPDYATTHLIYSPNGSLFYLWSNANERRIYMRVRPAGAAEFGPRTLVLASGGFPSHFDAVARSDGEVFVFYREFFTDAFVPLRYVVVGVVGNTSAPVALGTVESRVLLSAVRAATGLHGELAVGYTLADGIDGHLQAHIAIWNGSGFTLETLTEPRGAYADPMPAITPDGRYFVTYRGDSTGTDGLYYSERQPDGTWPIARLQKGRTDWSSMVSDAYGNLHLFYSNKLSGQLRIYYVVKPSGQDFETTFDAGSGTYFNIDGNVSIRDLIYGHAVVEDFSGGSVSARYFLFRSDLIPVDAGAISVDGGQQYTNKANPPVSFSGVVGDQSAMQVRYRWGAAPTDADAWATFSNPLVVAAPTLADPSACSEQTLYTQLRVGTGIQETPNQDSIIFDKATQATVSLANPNSAYDPAFTASPTAVLRVDSPNECIGLSAGTASGDISPATSNLALSGTRAFQTTLNLVGGEGLKRLTVNLSDLLGNTSGSVQQTITYDATKPVQTSTGTVTITPDVTNPAANIFATLEISGATLTEAGGLYGLLIQNQFTPTGGSPVAGIAPSAVPFSAMRAVSQAGGTVSLTLDWSLLSGIPAASIGPGKYTFTAYFVDKAGNRADQVAAQSGTITLAQINLLKTALPLVQR